MNTAAPPAEPNPVLSFEHVVLRFGGVTAIDHISFTVVPGELLAIIGPNGAGKTSVFNVISGVYEPQEGHVYFENRAGKVVELIGREPHDMPGEGIARTFQNIALFARLTVTDNLMLGRHHAMRSGLLSHALWLGRGRRDEVENRRKVEEIIDFLEITEHRKSPVGALPYGLQKRVELGRALAMEPKLLLLDEPVAGMNLEETEDIARFILQVRDEIGCAQILVEHDMGLVMDIADRVVAVDFGREIATGTPEEVQQNRDVIKAYLGEEHADQASADTAAAEQEASVEEGEPVAAPAAPD